MEELNLDKFRTLCEMKKFTESLWKEYHNIKTINKDLSDRLAHSEGLLKNVENIPSIEKKSMEEELILREINVIDRLSKQSPNGLCIEEVKQLKLLVDSIVALRKKDQAVVPKNKNNLNNKSTAELLSIVNGGNDN